MSSRNSHVMLPTTPAPTPSENQILVALTPTNLKREGRLHISIDASGNPTYDDPEPEKLVRGDLKVGDEKMTFYVPMYGPHPLITKDNHSFENKSTLLSVDSNHDGKLDDSEGWWSSLPVRLGDQMFQVVGIDPGSNWILLGKSSARLAGAVNGKRCPGFQFVTTDGAIAALPDYKGKWLLLDIWSMT